MPAFEPSTTPHCAFVLSPAARSCRTEMKTAETLVYELVMMSQFDPQDLIRHGNNELPLPSGQITLILILILNKELLT